MEIAAITHGALLGLAYLHSHNMIHRWGCVISASKHSQPSEKLMSSSFNIPTDWFVLCIKKVQCKLVDFLFLPVTDFDLLCPHQRRESW